MRDCLRLAGRRTTRDLDSATGGTAAIRRLEAAPVSPDTTFPTRTAPETEPVR
ncbi:hypothetical protein [Streptomyces xylophagus]|uniref:hypothetical protein n=1 Tax=Streptomyces xylophagus TaxID=285514 RepID=UPI000AB9628C|nr:hypothetical protein [Streptomyces xylophagus]